MAVQVVELVSENMVLKETKCLSSWSSNIQIDKSKISSRCVVGENRTGDGRRMEKGLRQGLSEEYELWSQTEQGMNIGSTSY